MKAGAEPCVSKHRWGVAESNRALLDLLSG
jgi:hypothetical protein